MVSYIGIKQRFCRFHRFTRLVSDRFIAVDEIQGDGQFLLLTSEAVITVRYL